MKDERVNVVISVQKKSVQINKNEQSALERSEWTGVGYGGVLDVSL